MIANGTAWHCGAQRGPAGCKATADAPKVAAGVQGPRSLLRWRELRARHGKNCLPMPANARRTETQCSQRRHGQAAEAVER